MYQGFLEFIMSFFPDTPFFASMSHLIAGLAIITALVIIIGILVSITSAIRRALGRQKWSDRQGPGGPTGRRW